MSEQIVTTRVRGVVARQRRAGILTMTEVKRTMASRSTEPFRLASSSDCEKLLPCATFSRSSNGSGRVPSKKTLRSVGHPSGVHPNHPGPRGPSPI